MDEQYELPPGAVTIAPGVLTTIVRMTTLAHPGATGAAHAAQLAPPARQGRPG